MLIACRLGLADLRHERLMAICQGLALAAVLAPLLILYGLKHGIVTGTLQALREQPANREILVLGNNRLLPADLDALRQLPEVGFLVPKPRSFARTLYIERREGAPRGLFEADLIPSATGDPLLPAGAPALAENQIALAAQLATRMQLGIGDRVQGNAVRGEMRGTPERLTFDFAVAQILPEGLIGRRSALLAYSTLDRIEAFIDGYALPDRGIASGTPLAERRDEVESLRLYARTIEVVPALSARLQAPPLALDVRAEVDRIEAVQALDRNLRAVFSWLVLIGGSGYLAALGTNVWANVARKREALSIVRLLGGSSAMLIAFPVVQALAIALLGFALAAAGYGLVALTINARFAAIAPGGPVCVLEPQHILLAALATHLGAALAALAGGLRAARLQPGEGIRRV
jgi:putative ABC transport system permease protein